jgi:hypothetical protein
VPVAVVGAAAAFEASYGVLAADVLLAAVLGAAAVAIAGAGLHRTRSSGPRLLLMVGVGSAGGAYLILAHAVDAALASSLPAPGAMVPGLAWLAVVSAAAGVTAAVVRGLGGRRARSVHAALYGALVVPRITEGPGLVPAPLVPVARTAMAAAPGPDAPPAAHAGAVGVHPSVEPLGARS